MKMKTAIASMILGLAPAILAQQPASTVIQVGPNGATPASMQRTITFSDQFCDGFITKEHISAKNMIGGGINTPDTARYNAGEFIFIMGDGMKIGDKLAVVRELNDPNRYETFQGQHKLVRATGLPYADIGHVSVVGHQNNAYIAKIDFSCEAVLPGDIVVPMPQRAQVNYEVPSRFDRFPSPNKDLEARIVLAKDFDATIGTGQKVYLNMGSEKGVKVGDYFRITRSFTANLSSEVDALSYKSPMGDETQKVEPQLQTGRTFTYPRHPVVKIKDFPRVALGELVILNVTSTSSTAMVTFALQDVQAGDTAERIPGPNDATTAEQK